MYCNHQKEVYYGHTIFKEMCSVYTACDTGIKISSTNKTEENQQLFQSDCFCSHHKVG